MATKKDDLFESGLKVRKEVLTAEYVDKQFANASEFSLPMQEMATRAWGLTWARPGLPHKIRSMLNIAFLTALDKPQAAVNPALFKKIPYDPIKDFEPITLLATGPYVLVVHPSLPVKNVKELIALARARPGQLTYASSGNGSGGHLANELLNSMAKVKMVHVPYKGGGPALTDLLAGNVQVLFSTWVAGKPHIDSGRIRALAVSTAKRLSGADIPTVAEAGLPGYDAGVWYAFLAPAGTPRDIVQRLNSELLKAAAHPDFKQVLSRAALEPIGSTPEELAKFMKVELAKWAKVVKDANIQVD